MSESAPRISDEAVEELAKRIYEKTHGGVLAWAELDDVARNGWRDHARGHLTAILPLLCGGLEEELKQVRKEHDEAKEAVRRQVAGREAEASERAEKAEQELEQARGHVQDQRVEKVQAKQQLNQVREEVERLVDVVVTAWPIICDGTPDEVAPIRAALNHARGVLDSSSSQCPNPDCKDGWVRITYEDGSQFPCPKRSRCRVCNKDASRPRSSSSVSGDDCKTCEGSGDKIVKTGPSEYEAVGPCPDCNSGDVEERGEEEARTVQVRLPREQAQHLFERCTESTNAPKINGYSCEDCRTIGEILRRALGSRGDQPNPEPHLSGDGERLEGEARLFAKLLRDCAGERTDAPVNKLVAVQNLHAAADLLEVFASRLSSEDSSGVEEGLERVWLIRVKNVLEPKALLCMDAEQAQGWRETGADVIAYVPALTQPDPTTRLSEGTGDELLDRLEADDPTCLRCRRPESEHVPGGPPSPPLVKGHLGATEDRPGCCNDFQGMTHMPVLELPHLLGETTQKPQDEGER